MEEWKTFLAYQKARVPNRVLFFFGKLLDLCEFQKLLKFIWIRPRLDVKTFSKRQLFKKIEFANADSFSLKKQNKVA